MQQIFITLKQKKTLERVYLGQRTCKLADSKASFLYRVSIGQD